MALFSTATTAAHPGRAQFIPLIALALFQLTTAPLQGQVPSASIHRRQALGAGVSEETERASSGPEDNGAGGWMRPRFEKLDMDLDIAAGRGLEEAVIQSTEIGTVKSWLRNQPEEIVSAAVASLREELRPYAGSMSVRLPGAMWLISSVPA